MGHLYPGYTLAVIWTLPYLVWLAFEAEVDHYHEALAQQQAKAATGG